MKVRTAAVTHEGLHRPNNEDAFLDRPESGLFIVCDGMGGHDGGEIASRMAITTIEQSLLENPRLLAEGTVAEAADAMEKAVIEAHDAIVAASLALGFERPMGTTVVAVLLVRDTAVVASVGDSRAYLLLGGRYLRITRDHTLANQYAELGLIPRSAVRGHPLRNVLARVVGSPTGVSVDIWEVPLLPGSRLLLCTDGLSEMVEEEESMRILREASDPETAVKGLVASALEGGGRDNVTVVVVEREVETEAVGQVSCCA